MVDYHIITRDRHGLKHWLKPGSYKFATGDALCALVAQELPKAMLALPVGFIAEGETYIPVAVQGLSPGQNLFVAPDGRWLAAYIPAFYRGYPYRISSTEDGEQVLCIDEASGLLSKSEGEPIFNEDGTPAQSVVEILNFFTQVEANRQPTRNICAVLQRHGLIQPWPITVQRDQGNQVVEGLFRIDEDILNTLTAEALIEIRDSGALKMAYCQVLSMQHLSTLGVLEQAHAENAKTKQASLSQSGELKPGFINDSGTFSFGN